MKNKLMKIMKNLYDKEFMKYAFIYHNVDDIPRSERVSQFISYALINEMKAYFPIQSYANIILQESEELDSDIEPRPIEDVFNELRDDMYFSEWQFIPSCYFGVDVGKIEHLTVFTEESKYAQEKVILITADILDNIDIIDKKMEINGYYRIARDGYVDKEGKPWVYALYNPIKKTRVSDMIRNEKYDLNHFAPAYLKDSIDKYGLNASNNNPLYKFKEKRVYMYMGAVMNVQILDKRFLAMLKDCAAQVKKTKPDFNGEYVVYFIDFRKLPETMEFYRDPFSYQSCFTTENIPLSAMSVNQFLI